MSDAQRPDETDAEPVDAEFEPAPDAASQAATPKPARRTPWLTLVLVTVLAGAIGGGSGWLIGRYGPDPQRDALSARIAALETAGESPESAAAVEVIDSRLAAVEAELAGAQLRADGVEQLVRDVASLRTQVEALAEAAPTAAGADAAADLQARLDAALSDLNDRIARAETLAETARAQAEQAQAALQQALSLMAQSGASDTADGALAETPGQNPAFAAALAQAEARLSALEAAQADLAAQAARLDAVEAALAALSEIVSEPREASEITARLDALETALASVQADLAVAPPQRAERAVAFAALSRAASGAEPFPVVLADLQRLWPEAPGAAGLTAIARTGAPTADQLIASFPVEAVRAATGEAQMLFGVIRVEREGEAGPTDAVMAALEADDLAAAVAAAQALDESARQAAAAWLSQAEARLAIDQAISEMSARLSAGEGGRL